MLAFAITDRESTPAVQELPDPWPVAGEVLVAVAAASVNGFDVSVAAGHVWDMVPHEFPVVLGRDFVGTVESVGEGVEDVAVGDRVAAVIPGMELGVGAIGEQVVVDASAVVAVPSSVSVEDAAVVGLAGVAAHDAVAALDVAPGEFVLVVGATGGVGSIAVQLAAAAGASVIATARQGREEDYVRGLGAAYAVDYTDDLTAAVRAIAPNGADKALHAAGDPAVLGRVVRAGAVLATILGGTNEQFGRDDITVKPIMAAATADKLARLLDDVAAGKLHVNVEATVPLQRAGEAFEFFTDGTLGKVLVTRS